MEAVTRELELWRALVEYAVFGVERAPDYAGMVMCGLGDIALEM
jgi:hypothetical protein